MKTMTKLFCLGGLLVGLAGQQVRAETRGELGERKAAALTYWVEASSSDSKAMILYYVGSSTEAVVTITNSAITAYAPAGTADTTFGTASGQYDLSAAAYDTMGELCDAIDALSNYGCNLLGGKRDDNTTRLANQTGASGTNDLKAAGGFLVEFDTGTVAGGDPGSAYDLRVYGIGKTGKRLVLNKCEWHCNGVAASTPTLRVFGKSFENEVNLYASDRNFVPDTFDTADRVFSEIVADDTAESWDWTATSGNNGWVFATGADVVVSCGNETSIQAPGNYLRCQFEER